MDNAKTILTALVIILSLVLLIVIGLVVFVFLNYDITLKQDFKDINSFEECVAAGYPVLESYPEQCITDDGKRFTNPDQQVTPPDEGQSEPGMPPQTEPSYPDEPPVYEGDGDVSCVDTCGDGQCAEIVCLGTGCSCAETPESCPVDCS